MARGLLENSTPDDQPGVWLAIGQMDVSLRRWKDAEDAFDKAEPLTTKKEDRTYLFFLKVNWLSGKTTTEPAEQSSARPSSSTPPTP